jgi:methylenetetrahydrofolate dehydrogenase (NADP+)/methenyltetrahydrofolate cyclohydrolase
MAKLLEGKQVADAMSAKQKQDVEYLKARGVAPVLAVLRVGERPDDVAYERGAVKRCESVGIAIKRFVLPKDATQSDIITLIETINGDATVHGALIFRPLPKHMDDRAVCDALDPAKDVDGITSGSMSGVYAGTGDAFAPCTARACLEILEYYGYDVTGKKITVIGRSLVVGKPVAMLLTNKNATVTICHTRTVDLPSLCRAADIVIVAAGRAKIAGKQYFSPGQTVIDVGINIDETGKLVGDVDFDEAAAVVAAITPVPGGVGSVTASVLARHVITAAG